MKTYRKCRRPIRTVLFLRLFRSIPFFIAPGVYTPFSQITDFETIHSQLLQHILLRDTFNREADDVLRFLLMWSTTKNPQMPYEHLVDFELYRVIRWQLIDFTFLQTEVLYLIANVCLFIIISLSDLDKKLSRDLFFHISRVFYFFSLLCYAFRW